MNMQPSHPSSDSFSRIRTQYCAMIRLFVLLATVVGVHVIFPSAHGFGQTGAGLTPPSPGSDIDASSQNTLFVPLKIQSSLGPEELMTEADGVFTSTLAEENISLLPREYAVSHLDYDKEWPPSFEAIQRLSPPIGIDYVATGTLTRLGNALSIDVAVFDLLNPQATRYFFRGAETVQELPAIARQIVADIIGHTGRHHSIAAMEVEGNKRIEAGAILRNISSREGGRYAPAMIREDMKSIFSMGYFDDIRVYVDDTEQGKKVTFQVQEKEIIGQVLFVDNKALKEEDLKGVITVAPNTIINPKELRRSLDNIKKLYKEKGYYNTEVTTDLSYPKTGRVDIRFVLNEGKKIYIKEVRMTGNNVFSYGKLKHVIETSPKGWFSWLTDSGVLKREIVEQDAARIAAFYHNNGYIDARVGEPEITQEENWLYVTFHISEGERYRVGNVRLVGDLIEDGNTLLGMSELLKQEFFSRNTLREDIIRLSDFYAEKGYAYAEITPEVEKTTEDLKVDVTLSIQKKELVHVNRILVKGNKRTRDKVIRREILLKEKEVYNATALKKSNQKLQRLGFFEEVNITPEPTLEEDEMDIVVEVEEKPTGTFSLGAGYSSVDSFLFMGEISESNFLGRGQRLALKANISGRSSQYDFSFTEPHLGDSDLLFGFNLYDLMREYDDYTKESQGFGLNFGYPLSETWRLFWGYDFDDTNLTDIDYSNLSSVIRESLDIHETRSVRIGVRQDTRDRIFNPSQGTEHRLETKYAGGSILGGDSAFTKIQGSTSWYYPFYLGTTLHMKGSVGYATENSGGKLPVYEKFYLGGIYSIRGFKSGHISPRDPLTDDRIGGDKMWYYNIELIFPLVKDAGLNGVVFFDAGNVYGVDEDWEFDQIKKSTGMGFRWLSPMGPLRLEWGYNLDPVGDEDSDNWDFSIGGSF